MAALDWSQCPAVESDARLSRLFRTLPTRTFVSTRIRIL